MEVWKKSQSGSQPRKDDGKVRFPSSENDGQDGFPARENGGLPRKDMDLEATPEEIESEVVHEEVPKEEVAVKNFRSLKKWHGAGI
jgi:hypothetical protein